MTGSSLGARLNRWGPDRIVLLGLMMASLGGAILIAVSVSEPGLGWGPLGVVVPVGISTFGMGLYLPNGVAGAIGPFPQMAGAASGLLGFFQMAAGALSGIAVAALFDGTGVPMALGIGSLSAIALVGFWFLRIQPVKTAPNLTPPGATS